MEQMLHMRCYHHCNCEDRPAVSRCSKCGKGLCRECTDNLKSEQTGKMLCTDCLNEELRADAAWAVKKKDEIKKEIIFIVVGFVIGLVIEIFLAIMAGTKGEVWLVLFFLSFLLFFPTLFASFLTIIKKVRNTIFILKLPFFIILCFISPIMFVWRIVKRAKDIKRLKRFAELQSLKAAANKKYATLAASMTTRLTTEQFEQRMIMKYGALLKTNQEEAERRIAEEREKAEKAEQASAESERKLKEVAADREKCESQMAELRAKVDEDKINRLQRRARKESRIDRFNANSEEDAA